MPVLSSVPSTTPVGVRDFPPELAAAFYTLQDELFGAFRKQGYERVLTPTFELASVFERGLGANEAARVMRFVDPQNGEILALRTDITPQIARMMAGSMANVPLPVRVCYFGRVFRLRHHHDFHRREVAQAGVELIGPETVDADAEIITLCDSALTTLGIENHTISIGHSGCVAAAFDGLDWSDEDAETMRTLLARKDTSGVQQAGAAMGLPSDRIALFEALTELYGEPTDVIQRVRATAPHNEGLQGAASRLETLISALSNRSISGKIMLDLGESQGFGYYTGFVLHAYVPGLGQAVCSGGRYDNLLSQYGRDAPAAGFAMDEEGLTEIRMRSL